MQILFSFFKTKDVIKQSMDSFLKCLREDMDEHFNCFCCEATVQCVRNDTLRVQ